MFTFTASDIRVFIQSEKRFYVTNRELGNQLTIINTLCAKFKALWIAQSKEPYLPQYLYRLCSSYVTGDNPRRFIPVKLVGKQPNRDVWVFNESIQMDKDGRRIDEEDMEFIVIEDDRLPLLKNVSGEFDQGEALCDLLEAEKNLFKNNFPQVVMAHAASSIAANYDLVVKEFNGCATPILKGHPVSGKTTALFAVLSVFGQTEFTSESSSKYIENKQSQTTLPFGWDDASCMKTLKSMLVNSYNACGSATLRTSYRPHTVPMVTTNLDCNDVKIKSRWLRIPFEELDPRLKGLEKINAESELREAMQHSHRSLPFLTSSVHRAIAGRLDDPDFIEITELLEAECDKMKDKVDHRAQNMFSLMLFCAKKILQSVNCSHYYDEVWQKAINLVIPSYASTTGSSSNSEGSALSANATDMNSILERYLKEVMMQTVMAADKEDVLQFFDQDYTPTKCLCGDSITFSIPAATSFIKQKCSSEIPPVSEAAIRNFIKNNGIGCVGNQVRFRNRAKQCHAAHIQRAWFDAEDIRALDEKLGKRSKKEKNKKRAKPTCTAVKPTPCTNQEHGQDTGDQRLPAADTDVVTVPNENDEGQGQGEEIQKCPEADVVIVPTEQDSEEQQGEEIQSN